MPRRKLARSSAFTRASSSREGPSSSRRATSSSSARSSAGEILARLRGHLDHEEPADLAQPGEGLDLRRDLLVAHEPAVQARGLARAEHRRREREPIAVGASRYGGTFQAFTSRACGTRSSSTTRCEEVRFATQGPGRSSGGPGGMSPKYWMTLRSDFLGVDVARDHDHGVRRAVPGAEPRAHVVERRRVEILHRADRRPRVRVSGRIGALDEHAVELAVGLVLALALLVLDHAALLVEARLVDHAEQVPHAVGFHPERHVERGARHVLEVVGAVGVGRPVDLGRAHPIEDLEVLVVPVLAALEHQVLEQVREAGLPGALVLRPHVVPDVDGDDRRLVVLVHDQRQPVVEDEALVGNRIGFALRRRSRGRRRANAALARSAQICRRIRIGSRITRAWEH